MHNECTSKINRTPDFLAGCYLPVTLQGSVPGVERDGVVVVHVARVVVEAGVLLVPGPEAVTLDCGLVQATVAELRDQGEVPVIEVSPPHPEHRPRVAHLHTVNQIQ